MMALLQLHDYNGIITVDGQDISLVPLSVVRQRCFITIPQDTFMILDETLAFNLDPSLLASDYILQDALTKVGLWAHLSANCAGSERGPLDRKLSSLPSLSVGQSQLLAMGRAIVQKHCIRTGQFENGESSSGSKPILLLDEATSSLDPATEITIYDLLESEFVDAGHTVVIVAHRLNALAGKMRPEKDMVAMLERGCLDRVGTYDDMEEFVTSTRISCT